MIGAGISGLSTAYELSKAGHDVVVVDRGRVGGGMTARTSAHLSYEIDDTYFALIEKRGERAAKQYLASQKAAIDRIEEICSREKIGCDFARIDLFVFAADRRGREKLAKEFDAVRRLGFEGVGWADAPVQGKTTGCLRFPDQARFHPLLYLAGLAKASMRQNARIYANTAIVSVDESAKGPVARTAGGQLIRAKTIVEATNAPIVAPIAIHKSQAPYRSYVITLEMKGAAFDSLIWDTDNPYHYVRTFRQRNETLLIVGGEDHKTGAANDGDERVKRLELWARARFADLGKVRHAWSGQVYEPADYVPFVGRSPGHKNVYIVTGDSGEGLTTGVAASLILPDLIGGRKNKWTAVYRPNRKIESSAASYAKQAAGVARYVIGKVLQREIDPKKISRNGGAIVTVNGQKVAAYRDARGKLHTKSAACTHVGCGVKWNSFERCWDCPCHGSQFAALGQAVQAPAIKPLSSVKRET